MREPTGFPNKSNIQMVKNCLKKLSYAFNVLAAMAFTAQGLKPQRTIKLLFAADEEVGSVFGIDWLVKNHGSLFRKNDMVLVPDGGDTEGKFIEVAEKYILWMKFATHGKQAHGSMPDLGANAFLAASDLALRLHNELSAKRTKIEFYFVLHTNKIC